MNIFLEIFEQLYFVLEFELIFRENFELIYLTTVIKHCSEKWISLIW